MLGTTILATMAAALVAVLPVRASFDLKSPQPFGAVDPSRAQEWPCGGQDLEERAHVFEWPVRGDGGIDVTWDTPDTSSSFRLTALLLNATADPTYEEGQRTLNLLYSTKPGPFCLSDQHGVPEWVGLDAVLQVRQWVGVSDYLYSVSPPSSRTPAPCLNQGREAA